MESIWEDQEKKSTESQSDLMVNTGQSGEDKKIMTGNGWYQGAGGDIGVIKNNDWDTIVIKDFL